MVDLVKADSAREEPVRQPSGRLNYGARIAKTLLDSGAKTFSVYCTLTTKTLNGRIHLARALLTDSLTHYRLIEELMLLTRRCVILDSNADFRRVNDTVPEDR